SAMQIGMIGLGRMGANMVQRLLAGNHQCVVFDRSPKAVDELTRAKAIGASSIADFVKQLETPAPVLLTGPAGAAARRRADGPGGGRGYDDLRSRLAPHAGRHPHRRR